jgi:hypothetical protein
MKANAYNHILNFELMALSEAEFDRIEAFLDGSLPPDERQQMEADMAQDSDLQRAVEEHRVIWEGLQVPVAVEYFQEMHGQLDQQGLLQVDDIWVEADQPDDATTDHPAHHAHDDEPEVFVADDPKTDLGSANHHIDVAVNENSDTPLSPEQNETHDGWNNPNDFESPHTHFDGPDDYV